MRLRPPSLALAALMMSAGCFLFPPTLHYQSVLAPALEAAPAPMTAQEDGAVSYELQGLRIEVNHLTDRELNDQFPEESRRGRYSTNPYTYGDWVDPRLGYTPNRFTVFAVQIYNRTEPKVLLDPLQATLRTDRGDLLQAYGVSAASAASNFENYYRSRRGLSGNEFYRFELRMGIVRSHNFETDQPIFKGENYGGFIVFDAVDPETRRVELSLEEFVLRFGAFDQPAETLSLVFPFDHTVQRGQIQDVVTAGSGDDVLAVSEDGPSRLVGNLPDDRMRSASAIQAEVRQRLPALHRCFVEEFDKGEAQEGSVVLGFVIEPSGAVSRVGVAESHVASTAVDQCLEGEVGRWTFRPAEPRAAPPDNRTGALPVDSGPGPVAGPAPTLLPVEVTYPFNFTVGDR